MIDEPCRGFGYRINRTDNYSEATSQARKLSEEHRAVVYVSRSQVQGPIWTVWSNANIGLAVQFDLREVYPVAEYFVEPYHG